VSSTPPDAGQVRALPTIHSLDVEEIRESPTNPRKIPERAIELVAQSIQRFGWKQPLVVDRDRYLIVGHTRYRAARLLGLTRVPGIIADDLAPAEVNAYRIADNRTHDFTTWDMPELARQLEELAGEFSDVLALANWETALAELEQMTAEGDGEELAELDLPSEAKDALDGGFQLNVCFHSKEDALAAESAILDLPGAFDVRHKF
jgi:hypothetical protein